MTHVNKMNKLIEAAATQEQSETFASLSIVGNLDTVADLEAQGWARNVTDPAVSACVDVTVNGLLVKERLVCDHFRQDLQILGGDGKYAFSFKLNPLDLRVGVNTVRVVSSETGKDLENSPLGFSFSPNFKVKGAIDKSRNESIICGWAAYDPPLDFVALDVYADGKFIARTAAKSYRRDLDQKKIGKNGYAGFEIVAPSHLFDNNTHTIEIREASSGKPISKREDAKFSQNKPYHDFDSFMSWAFFFREMQAPFSEHDKRVLGYCDWLKKRFSALAYSNNEMPLVSIIMPTYNRAHSIEPALASALGQTYQNVEVIVVDDGGEDETPYIIDAFGHSHLRYIRLEKNVGVSAARNHGLRAANGKYIAYLDSDNWWDASYIEVMIKNLQENPNFDCAYCGQYLYKGSSNKLYSVRIGPYNPSMIYNRNFIDLNAFIHTREIYEKNGGFDEGMRRLVDWDLILRYAKDKKPLFVPCNLSHYVYNDEHRTITNSEAIEGALDRLIEKQGPVTNVGQYDEAQGPLRLRAIPHLEQPSSRKPVSVIIPSYNIPAVLKISVEQLCATLAKNDEIIIVDNGSDPETIKALCELRDKDERVFVQFNRANEGFSRAINQGAALANISHDLVIFNNDAIATKGWIEELSIALQSDASIGAVAPQQVLLPYSQTMLDHVPACDKSREVDVNLSWHHKNLVSPESGLASKVVEVNFVPFFCILVRRDLFDQLGGLDDHLGRHYRSDRLFCNALRNHASAKILHVTNAKVYHLLQQSTRQLMVNRSDEYAQMFERNSWEAKSDHVRPVWE
jgi:O-antigen biosynthesis protein